MPQYVFADFESFVLAMHGNLYSFLAEVNQAAPLL